MKKLIAAILLTCTGLSLAACGQDCDICGSSGADTEVLGMHICDGCMGEMEGF